MERNRRKERIGVVVSDKAHKTVTFEVSRLERHPLYGKFVTRRAKFMAHDEENACRVGDRIRVMETRPLSKNKRWRVVEVIDKTNAS